MTKHEKWLIWLEEEKNKDYYKAILKKLAEEEKNNLFTPDPEYRLRALEFSDIEKISLIITATKPIIEPYAADGLAWSSLDSRVPTIYGLLYKKLYNELGIIYDQSDHSKEHWEKQGILLLNRELVAPVEKKAYNLFEDFTYNVLQYFLNDNQRRAFLMLDEQCEWEVFSNPYNHLIVTENIFSKKHIFNIITSYLRSHCGVNIDWT
jgi:Uracil DNA glycosylase